MPRPTRGSPSPTTWTSRTAGAREAGASPERSLALIGELLARSDKDPFSHKGRGVDLLFRQGLRAGEPRGRGCAFAQSQLRVGHQRARNPTSLPRRGRCRRSASSNARLTGPAQPQHKHFLGAAYFLAGDYEAAAAVFKERIARTPNTDLTRAYLASTLGASGPRDEARAIWRELMEINPKYSYVEHVGRLPFKKPRRRRVIVEGLKEGRPRAAPGAMTGGAGGAPPRGARLRQSAAPWPAGRASRLRQSAARADP